MQQTPVLRFPRHFCRYLYDQDCPDRGILQSDAPAPATLSFATWRPLSMRGGGRMGKPMPPRRPGKRQARESRCKVADMCVLATGSRHPIDAASLNAGEAVRPSFDRMIDEILRPEQSASRLVPPRRQWHSFSTSVCPRGKPSRRCRVAVQKKPEDSLRC